MKVKNEKESQKPKAGKGKSKNSKKAPKKDLTMWYDNTDAKIALNISDSTLARYRKKNIIPFTKVGNKFYYPRTYFEDSLMNKLANKHLIEQ